MPKVTYIEHDGRRFEVDLPEGWSLMQGALLNGVTGIEGECGGSCGCATCHLYVDEAFVDRLPEIAEAEDEMLDCTVAEREANSRLGCQIKMTADLDGLVVRLPEEQS
ncbi:2Fe-2S iron-sulfur cluster-binding protein [Rhodobium gokarnense]|uniref:2Fe-2S ferredoxin n=1 Tax=Rhodobium gokarnense TaxID=364296 RepID=A0ABT3HAS8_9HYPH|nr:2Fe-2S iron-sulfur cluster-binding protein [Rhodobium gokarnense]MCW2307503.1 2Fe-2S ferredoxin [Rhodobium gokarnense]